MAGFPYVEGVEFSVGCYSGRRDGTDPACCPLPGPYGPWVVYVDNSAATDNRSDAFESLPFERVAGESFGSSSLPDKSPEAFIALGSFSCLDAGKLRRRCVTVVSQQIFAVEQEAAGQIVRQSNQPAVYGVVVDQCLKMSGDFALEYVWFEIEEIVAKNSGPDYVDGVYIGSGGPAFEEPAPQRQLFPRFQATEVAVPECRFRV